MFNLIKNIFRRKENIIMPEKTRKNKDGATFTVKFENKKYYLIISDGKNTSTMIVNKAQAKGILNDLKAVLEGDAK